jgi:formate dehydrogenase subunit gamma
VSGSAVKSGLLSNGGHVIRVCLAEFCRSAGSENLVAHLDECLGIRIGETTPDGGITVSPIYCLGNCSRGPALMIDGQNYSRVTPGIVNDLIGDLKKSAERENSVSRPDDPKR